MPGEPPPVVEEPALPGGFVVVPAVALLCPPELDEVPPLPVPALPAVLSSELPPQAVAALKPNTKIPNRCFIDSPRVCELNTTLMIFVLGVDVAPQSFCGSTSAAMRQGNQRLTEQANSSRTSAVFLSAEAPRSRSVRRNRHMCVHDANNAILDGCNFPARVSQSVPL